MRLKDKVAIVTGVADYIGQAVAVRLAEEGAKLVINDLDKQKMGQVARETKRLGREVVAIEADITKREQVKDLVNETFKRFGRLDILANTAGGHQYDLVTELSEEVWDHEIDLNLKASFNCIRAVAEYMIKQRYGKIINFSSTAKDGVPWFSHRGHSSFAAARAGVIGLTRSLAYELGAYNININCIVLGPIETPRTKEIFGSLETDPKAEVPPTKMIALKRLGKPIDVANAVLFLASDEANYITGHSLYVSGGLYGV